MAGLETGFEALRARFKDLDDRMTGAAQVATRLGDRLQVCYCRRSPPCPPALCSCQALPCLCFQTRLCSLGWRPVQTAEMFRERATEAINMVQYLQQFSRTADFQDLSDIFHKDGDLDHAAVRCHIDPVCAVPCCVVNCQLGLKQHTGIY